jgi:hypothetical protein
MLQVHVGPGLELSVENPPFDVAALKVGHPVLTANNDALLPGRTAGQG